MRELRLLKGAFDKQRKKEQKKFAGMFDKLVDEDAAAAATVSNTPSEVVQAVSAQAAPPLPPTPKLPPAPPRSGEGYWDDVGEQQLMLALSASEGVRACSGGGMADGSLRSALIKGMHSGSLRVYANAPRYDRLVLWTHGEGGGMPGSATYTVEAELDAWEGTAWWMTKDLCAADFEKQGLQSIDGGTLETEYSQVLTFLEGCRKLGAPRYTMKTELSPDSKPHVIAVVEKVIAASSLRFLLSDDVLKRI